MNDTNANGWKPRVTGVERLDSVGAFQAGDSGRRRRLMFTGGSSRRIDFELLVGDERERTVSVLIAHDGVLEFPHIQYESGESLGDDAADREVLLRAAEEAARCNIRLRRSRR